MSHMKKTVREKSRECHNHKTQSFLDTKRKRKQTKPDETTDAQKELQLTNHLETISRKYIGGRALNPREISTLSPDAAPNSTTIHREQPLKKMTTMLASQHENNKQSGQLHSG